MKWGFARFLALARMASDWANRNASKDNSPKRSAANNPKHTLSILITPRLDFSDKNRGSLYDMMQGRSRRQGWIS